MKKFLLPLLACCLFLSCKNDDDQSVPEALPNIDGLAIAESENGFSETYSAIRATLGNNPNISILAEVDHSSNASSVDMELPETRVILFGNPNLGTPLMQENQLAGLDLPQKIVIYQEDNRVFAAYNTTAYLSSRHDLDVQSDEITQIGEALSDIVVNGTNVIPTGPDDALVASKEGIITVDSNKPFTATYSSIKAAIASNLNLNVIAEVDHQANGAAVGKAIRPTSLIIFGNPALGTPLMQDEQSIGIDLPQKMLVWRDDAGITHISYNDPVYLARRHDIDGNTEVLNTISSALAALSEAGAN